MQKKTIKILGMKYRVVIDDEHYTAIILDKWFAPPTEYEPMKRPGELYGLIGDSDDYSYLSFNGAIVDPGLMPTDDSCILQVLTRPNTGSAFPIFYLTYYGWHIVSTKDAPLYVTDQETYNIDREEDYF